MPLVAAQNFGGFNQIGSGSAGVISSLLEREVLNNFALCNSWNACKGQKPTY
jgi:hypothetical protein